MGPNALLTSLKLNYAAQGSPECARYRARIDEPPKNAASLGGRTPGGEHMKVDLSGGRFDAVLFDLDGVLTDTARIHEASWKKMFDAFLKQRAKATGEPFSPFEMEDYELDVNGRPRYDGVRDFLKSRGIELPEGSPEDPPDRETVCGLGNRKNQMVTEVIKTVGVDAYPGSVALVRYVRDHGLHTAVVSASANCAAVLEEAKIADMFEARVDGIVLEERHLRGKPEPDSFLEAARCSGWNPPGQSCSRMPSPGCRPAMRGRLVSWWASPEERRGRTRCERRRHRRPRSRGADPVSDSESRPHAERFIARVPRIRINPPDDLFPTQPWGMTATRYVHEFLAQAETIYALANGYLGLRGDFEEGTPVSKPGVFLNGFYETWPIVYGEAAYGFAKTGQTIVNATDGGSSGCTWTTSPWRSTRPACSSSGARSTGVRAPSTVRSCGRLPPASALPFRRGAWSR